MDGRQDLKRQHPCAAEQKRNSTPGRFATSAMIDHRYIRSDFIVNTRGTSACAASSFYQSFLRPIQNIKSSIEVNRERDFVVYILRFVLFACDGPSGAGVGFGGPEHSPGGIATLAITERSAISGLRHHSV